MNRQRWRLLVAASAVALMSISAWAQNQQVAANSDVETVVVTGSLIDRPGFTAPTPVSGVSTADLLRQAPTEIADALNQVSLGRVFRVGFWANF